MSDDPLWVKVLAATIVAVVAIGVLALLLGAVLGGAYLVEKRTCSNRAGEMQLAHKFKLLGGCFVQLPSGRYVNLDNIRFTENGKILVEP